MSNDGIEFGFFIPRMNNENFTSLENSFQLVLLLLVLLLVPVVLSRIPLLGSVSYIPANVDADITVFDDDDDDDDAGTSQINIFFRFLDDDSSRLLYNDILFRFTLDIFILGTGNGSIIFNLEFCTLMDMGELEMDDSNPVVFWD